MAAASIANIVKSSLGPVGLDKMLVDDIGVCVPLSLNVDRLMKLVAAHFVCLTVFALSLHKRM